ncbi:hypothetical protein DIE19_23735 [Burkholderia sp. Bp9126]|nr:hypothetical protein DIE19_23735 [Burkholderia sp. Bp9126]
MVIRSLPDPFDLSNPANTVLPQIGFVMAGTADVDYRIWGDGSSQAPQKLYGYDPVSQPKQVQAVNGYHDGLTNVNAQIQRNRQRRIDNYVTQGGDRNLIPDSVLYPYLSVDQVMACIQFQGAPYDQRSDSDQRAVSGPLSHAGRPAKRGHR